MFHVFIDGASGTTGLRLEARLSGRKDIQLIRIDEAHRKDPERKRALMNASDVTLLCLPDDAAKESAALCDDPDTVVIDTSTAHRTSSDWTYGFPELSDDQRNQIRSAKRITNPGCHAIGFISITAPLVQAGILPNDYPVSCFSLTGYSGGGKKMIADYENDKSREMEAPRLYGLSQSHKHLPEMQLYSGLTAPPVFTPIISDYYAGMATSISLDRRLIPDLSVKTVRDCLKTHYDGAAVIRVLSPEDTGFPAMLSANRMAGKDSMVICVNGNDDRVLVSSVFDNLGKGASGSAVQNMNLALGLEETASLEL